MYIGIFYFKYIFKIEIFKKYTKTKKNTEKWQNGNIYFTYYLATLQRAQQGNGAMYGSPLTLITKTEMEGFFEFSIIPYGTTEKALKSLWQV